MDGIDRANYIHASIQATLYNAHFDTKGVPWTADDLLGKGNREKRRAEQFQDRMTSARIARLMEKDDEATLPEWVRELSRNRKRVN